MAPFSLHISKLQGDVHLAKWFPEKLRPLRLWIMVGQFLAFFLTHTSLGQSARGDQGKEGSGIPVAEEGEGPELP